MKELKKTANQPIGSLQKMLRTISRYHGESTSLISDGVYGKETALAVSAFQKKHGLPATGITDQETWDCIVMEYDSVVVDVQPAQPCSIHMKCKSFLEKGTNRPCVLIAQCILGQIANRFQCICKPEINGIYDEATELSVSELQRVCGLPSSGKIDKMTWKHMALLYPMIENDQ